MKKEERFLFKELCMFKKTTFDESLLEYATPYVLGQLFFNRMQGVAFEVLKKHGLLSRVNREFRNALSGAYEQNTEKNNSFFNCIRELSMILKKCPCNVAMLKGAQLCALYPRGLRTSNDVDIMVLPDKVTTVGDLLYSYGFRQGNIRGGEFVPASRREIIESKMMRGETVPYIKEVNLPYMRYLEVDINFSLDYKNSGDDVLNRMLEKIELKNIIGDMQIPTFSEEDFFIHLCAHLYKETTTLPWVKMKRDMTLYKYCDIYMLLADMIDSDVEKMFKRAKELGMDKICAFAIFQSLELFDYFNSCAYMMSQKILNTSPDFLHNVFSPKDKKVYCYQNTDITDRFFMDDRFLDLKEVQCGRYI